VRFEVLMAKNVRFEVLMTMNVRILIFMGKKSLNNIHLEYLPPYVGACCSVVG
jgi:hypothetical protein